MVISLYLPVGALNASNILWNPYQCYPKSLHQRNFMVTVGQQLRSKIFERCYNIKINPDEPVGVSTDKEKVPSVEVLVVNARGVYRRHVLNC